MTPKRARMVKGRRSAAQSHSSINHWVTLSRYFSQFGHWLPTFSNEEEGTGWNMGPTTLVSFFTSFLHASTQFSISTADSFSFNSDPKSDPHHHSIPFITLVQDTIFPSLESCTNPTYWTPSFHLCPHLPLPEQTGLCSKPSHDSPSHSGQKPKSFLWSTRAPMTQSHLLPSSALTTVTSAFPWTCQAYSDPRSSVVNFPSTWNSFSQIFFMAHFFTSFRSLLRWYFIKDAFCCLSIKEQVSTFFL